MLSDTVHPRPPAGHRAISALYTLARSAAAVERRAQAAARHDWENVYGSLHARLAEQHGDLDRLRLLDFGCGYTYPLVVLFHGQVREIVGLDVAPVFRDGWLASLRWSGGLRKPGTMLETLLAHRDAGYYFRHLERCAGRQIRQRQYRIEQYAGKELPFPDASFDGILSNAVLQELPEPLEAFAREMGRVLGPGGWIDLEWHSFYSPSGHYMGSDASRRNPWGHLLGGRFHPSLNRATPDRVLEAFAPWFTELRLLPHDARHRIRGRDPDYEPEGAEDLTPELRDRLAQYPEEWLLTRGYILQGRRR